MPIPIPPPAMAWVSFTLATSASKPSVERAWIFYFPLTYGSAARFFPSILSLSLPGWLNELFSLLLALTFLCARWGERAGRGCPAGKQELDVHSTGSGWELENCQHWVVFPLLINERKTSSSPLECVCALE